MNLQIAKIITSSLVDGPGERIVLLVQGCPIHCPGCQNRHLWGRAGGRSTPVAEVARELVASGLPITISGGEPLAQAPAVSELLATIRRAAPSRHVILYTGYVLEDLLDVAPACPGVIDALRQADVLVDGPYIRQEDHDRVQWRGSDNQRPINLAESSINWDTRKVLFLSLLDWDRQTITIDGNGDLYGAAGEMRDLFGATEPTRRCGQAITATCPACGADLIGAVLAGVEDARESVDGVEVYCPSCGATTIYEVAYRARIEGVRPLRTMPGTRSNGSDEEPFIGDD